MSDLVGIAERYRASVGQPAALATVLSASGSTYRRSGARLLVLDDGTTSGSISGGCLESDLILYAREVIETGGSRIVTYRPGADDILFGTGLGCEGELTILVEPVRDELARGFEQMEEHVDSRGAVAITTIPEDVARAATTIGGAAAGDAPPLQRIPAARDEPEKLIQRIDPPFRLVVFGASPEASALVRIAATLRWRVTLADHRAAVATPDRFPDASAIVVAPIGSLVENAAPPSRAAAVIMTHNYLHDLELLRRLAGFDLAYLGLIGPRRRQERLVASLRDEGVHLRDDAIFGPAGLDLGAEYPEEIALAIVAEIQAVRAGATAGSLRNRVQPIHERPAGAGIAIVLLAAGDSTRLGTPKALLPVGHETLVERAAGTANASGARRVVLVTGPEHDAIERRVADSPVRVVANPDWKRGIATSIRTGIHAAEAAMDELRAIIIMLCDQPFITPAHLERLMTTWRDTGAPAVATAYAEGPGVPALFARALFDELLELDGDSGAREILRRLGQAVPAIDAIDTRDIDTPDDKNTILERCAIGTKTSNPEGDPDE